MSSDAPRYVCIHGHFYQPPRDNPWLESIEPQPSAAPFRDWNVRILNECYRPNAAARIVDGQGFITNILNNYSRISFNVGPTLMSWLQTEDPDTYEEVLRADRLSQVRFSGHGSALSQAYNHAIMPLCNERDRRTQVRWGIRDFEHRFKRRPEGMWLPETAVDTASLEALAAEGIAFTILAPHQALRVRPLDGDEWISVEGDRVDPRRTYRVSLPSGRDIDVFFYDGPTARAVAFERLLASGAAFADRLLAQAADGGLSHIATDGETYGHHHRHGDMALAFASERIDGSDVARLTNYGEFRERHPAAWEAEIVERSSWSCAHGVRRWHADCGCNSGANPGWHQRWRKPLREALDWLRDELVQVFEQRAAELLSDPWAARDDYIDVILDRDPDRVRAWLEDHAGRALSIEQARAALQLLEIQRNAMLMYTSCGWFFDDLAGTEGVQILRYAARAIELASRIGVELEEPFVERLERAPSNLERVRDGRRAWELLVKPSQVDLRAVIAHRAVMALLRDEQEHEQLYCYRVHTDELQRHDAGRAQLVVGRTRITSTITLAERQFCFAAMHLGDHNLVGGVAADPGDEEYAAIRDALVAPFGDADLVATQREIDSRFSDRAFSLRSLLPDQRADALALILEAPVAEAEQVLTQLYDRHAPLIQFLADRDLPQPEVLRTTAELVLNLQLRRALDAPRPDANALVLGFDTARARNISLNASDLSYALQRALERAAERLAAEPESLPELEELSVLAELAASVDFEVTLWHVQNVCSTLSRTSLAKQRRLAAAGNGDALAWSERFVSLCATLKLRVK